MKIKQFTLKNNLNVFLIPQAEATAVMVHLMVAAGSAHESDQEAGLAHFLEHTAFKGTKKWPTAQKLAQSLDEVGAVYNAHTNKTETVYWAKTAPDFLPLSLQVLAQMWHSALIKEKEIEIERGVIFEEINMYEDRPQRMASLLFLRRVFGETSLGRPVIGFKKTVAKIHCDNFLNFKKRYYRGGNMSLAVVGRIKDLKEAEKRIKDFFSLGAGGMATKKKLISQIEPEKTFWKKQKTKQTHFFLGGQGAVFTDKDKYALKILMAVLGGGMSSRLWREIRERRGLAYYVHCWASEYSAAGCWALAAGVTNEKAKEAIKIGRRELLSVGQTLKKSEVERVKKMVKGRFLISLEDPSVLAGLINTNWLFAKKLVLSQDVIKKIDDVDYQQVIQAAEKFLQPQKMRLVAIGPGKK